MSDRDKVYVIDATFAERMEKERKRLPGAHDGIIKSVKTQIAGQMLDEIHYMLRALTAKKKIRVRKWTP